MVALTTLTLWSLGQAIVVDARRGASTGRDPQAAAGRRGAGLRHPLVERADVGEPRRRSPDRAPRRPRPRSPSRSGTGSPRRWPRGGSRRRRGPPPSAGVGVLTTSRTSPDAIRSRIGDLAGGLVGRLAELGDRPRVVAGGGERRARAGRRRHPVAGRRRGPPASRRSVPLSRSAIDSSASAPVLARSRRHERGAEERLGQRDPRVGVDADDLAGRLHPGPDRRVDAAQLGGREGRRLDRDERRRREVAAVPAELRAAWRRARSGPPARPSARRSPWT